MRGRKGLSVFGKMHTSYELTMLRLATRAAFTRPHSAGKVRGREDVPGYGHDPHPSWNDSEIYRTATK